MWPPSDPSFRRLAQPRPLAESHSSLPSHVNVTWGRPFRCPCLQLIHPSTAMKRNLPPRPSSSMKAGPRRSIASWSQRSISVMRHFPSMLIAILVTLLRSRRPLAEKRPSATTSIDLHRDQVSGHRDLVQSDAANARDLRIEPGVVVTEEADPRTKAAEEVVQARGLADVAGSASVPSELHARGSVVHEQYVDPGVP